MADVELSTLGSVIKTAYEGEANTNAFTDAEKTKLSGVEALADVTDATNVEAAGALMDSEVTNLADVKAFDPADYATAAQGGTADSALQDVVDDTTPQLGGDLDGQGNTVSDVELTEYAETVYAPAALTTNTTLSLANGPIQRLTIDGTVQLTMPAGTGGESLTLIVTNNASDTHSWNTSPAIVWMSEEDSGTPPTAAADTYKTSYSFLHDGEEWLGWKTGAETA